jgi:RNA recognition motif-containing protein
MLEAQERTFEEVKMNMYVGNLSREVTEEDLRQAFEAFGEVTSVKIIKDKYSGQSRGFGFVEMPGKADADSAITGLKDKDLKGRKLNVNEARPRSGGGRQGGRGPGGGRRSGRGQGGGRWDGGRRSW